MRSKLPHRYPSLDVLLDQLGVPNKLYVFPDVERELKKKGVTIDSDEVQVARNGTLEYQGRKVVLYIRDVHGSLPKYHVVDCQTLKSMRYAGRHKRYVVTRRTDGEFLLNFADNLYRDSPVTYELDICKNCLWQELNLRHLSPDAFPLADWFNAVDASYVPPPRDGLYGPRTTPITGPVSNYPPDWCFISLRCRERAGWICESCGILLNLPHQRKFLHAHHKRGTMYNEPEDITALCIGCHANQPNHEKVRNMQEYLEFMKTYGSQWRERCLKNSSL